MPQTNLIPIPGPGGLGAVIEPLLGFSLQYGTSQRYAFYDTSVTHNGHPSIRVQADPNSGGTREVDNLTHPVKPGQRIVVRVWIKTGPSAVGDNNPQHGARIGWDYRGGGMILDARPNQADYDSGAYTQHLVQWNRDWAYKDIDMTVPAAFYTQYWQPSGGWATCAPTQISSISMWLDVRPTTDTGLAWFADAEWYILDAGEQPPPPIGTTPPPPPVNYVLDVWTAEGGSTTPTGLNSYPSGTQVTITATPSQGYVFSGWLVNNQPASANPLTLTISQNLTVMPIFNAVPTPPEPPPSGNNVIAAGAAIATVVAAVLFAVTR